MPDRNGWLTRNEAAECGKPLYITGGPGWRPERPKGWAILPKYRCAQLKAHVEATEQPVAYLHVRNAIPPYSYAPLYARDKQQIEVNQLTPGELAEAERGS
ncbi:hypothetical protein MKX34_11610 [Paenibacillus sp. FSL R5-0636]|uniref:hypothetical protein n=1 Tax=Paenibacillus TaxID=44249 RepID=UPI00096C2E4E|nr:hypothetical protein [Paenibacillus odorifer]OMD04708.1 hypothetical protein BJP49_22825 [Paenibacillus odorifer]OME09597.1 hypothetical protein BSK60_27575 [Paenibacillus odorifer]